MGVWGGEGAREEWREGGMERGREEWREGGRKGEREGGKVRGMELNCTFHISGTNVVYQVRLIFLVQWCPVSQKEAG